MTVLNSEVSVADGPRRPLTPAGHRPAASMSPRQLAAKLGQPSPTAEQSAVVGADLSPAVVVAGAGSGKTETMASRVVWLVANGYVRPEQVLGLTFTRKAAGELAERVRRRLLRLSDDADLRGSPNIITYDAFAGQLVSEHAGIVGAESSHQIITQAAAWQIAAAVVNGFDGDMSAVDFAPDTVVQHVLSLHGELAGHLREPEELQAFAAELRGQVQALPNAPSGKGVYKDVATLLDRQDARAALVPLVERFRAAKQQAELVDFADIAERAVAIVRRAPRVGARIRSRYRVVLLDEYQDTSHAQLSLLHSLFGEGHPVMAVGDPCQSIYAWRGASSATLARFVSAFSGADGRPPRRHTLATSFRNSRSILVAANEISAPLRREGLDVPVLEPRAGAPVGEVEVALHHSVQDEAVAVATRVRQAWDCSMRRIAVLVRTRAQIARIESALLDVKVPVEVVGVGGLLATAEVVDVVSLLRAAAHPERGDAVLRLLTGPRLRIGLKDVDALARWARARTDEPALARSDEADLDKLHLSDVLDDLPPPGWISPEGRDRIRRLAADVDAVRGAMRLPLPQVVARAVAALGLDVEVLARRGPVGRSNLDRLEQVAADFAEHRPGAGLSAFLAYLDAALTQEQGLRPGQVMVAGDRVQVLTVHAAKGLEWEAVFVPGMVEGVFPSGTGRDRAWLSDVGALPYPLRGDSASLPVLGLAAATDQREAKRAVDDFIEHAGTAARTEERRLAYVAITRAERLLVCSGYRWGDGTRPREPAEFLTELRATPTARTVAWSSEPGDRPGQMQSASTSWPVDPLGDRRATVEAAADLVRAARGESREQPTGAGSPPLSAGERQWASEIEVLLRERDRGHDQAREVPLPAQLSASQLVALHADPESLAADLRRPMPGRSREARRGSDFHTWLETHYGQAQLLDIDDLPGAADSATETSEDLRTLQQSFLASEWAERQPLDIEVGFDLVLAGRLVRGRMDAVFARGDGGLLVIDWKTGRLPRSPEVAASQSVQLAVYRLALARLNGLPLSSVSAGFHFVVSNRTIRPVDLLDESDLESLLDPATPV